MRTPWSPGAPAPGSQRWQPRRPARMQPAGVAAAASGWRPRRPAHRQLEACSFVQHMDKRKWHHQTHANNCM
eukprot:11218549-Lingulodinium_polyedra.AAC.1